MYLCVCVVYRIKIPFSVWQGKLIILGAGKLTLVLRTGNEIYLSLWGQNITSLPVEHNILKEKQRSPLLAKVTVGSHITGSVPEHPLYFETELHNPVLLCAGNTLPPIIMVNICFCNVYLPTYWKLPAAQHILTQGSRCFNMKQHIIWSHSLWQLRLHKYTEIETQLTFFL